MLLFTEGFDWTVTAADLVTYLKWAGRNAGVISNSSTIQRFGVGSGNYLAFSDQRNYVHRAIGQNLANGVIGVAMRIDFSATNLYQFAPILLMDSTSNQLGVMINTDLTMSIIRGGTNTVLATTTYTVPTSTWIYVELKWKISDSIASGDVVLYVDGTAVLTLAAATDTKNTANAYATHYKIGDSASFGATGNSLSAVYIDDHYLVDGTTPLGVVRVQTLNPNGNGNSSLFVGSDGNSVNNYQQVDDANLNIADYNDGVNVNDKDTYTFTDTASTTTVIKGVSVNMVAVKTDTAARSIVPVVRHSATDYDGTAIPLTTGAAHYQQCYDTNPGTSSGWTKSDVDAAEFGVKVSV